MNRQTKTYYAWLNNAYGQEVAMAKMYAMHARDVKKGLNQFPELSKCLEERAAESLEHARLMETCLARHSLSPNPAKIAFGWVMGLGLGFTGDVTIDKVIMNDLTDQGMAQFEVGAYVTLVAAAEKMNDPETAAICGKILAQERDFVTWLEERSGRLAEEFLDHVAG
jgi:ferritin-like metal-binding protein YciE